jgi:hypothetical protein
MSVDTLKSLADFLYSYGGWALSAILMMALVFLYHSMSTLLERRNNELKTLLAECKSVVAENRIFMERIGDNIESITGLIEKNTEVIRQNTEILLRLKYLLEEKRR